MTNVCIIDIDLGDIDKIVEEEMAELRGESKQKLEQAIQQRVMLENIRQEREKAKKEQTTKYDQMILNTYENLLKSSNRGIIQDQLLSSVQPDIKTISALTLRLKTYLREQGNKYVLGKKKISNQVYYYLESFN